MPVYQQRTRRVSRRGGPDDDHQGDIDVTKLGGVRPEITKGVEATIQKIDAATTTTEA